MSAKGDLTEENRIFRENEDSWAEQHEGKFVLIRGDDVVGFFKTSEEALSEGYRRFGTVPFFVGPVRGGSHQSHFVSRMAAPSVGW